MQQLLQYKGEKIKKEEGRSNFRPNDKWSRISVNGLREDYPTINRVPSGRGRNTVLIKPLIYEY